MFVNVSFPVFFGHFVSFIGYRKGKVKVEQGAEKFPNKNGWCTWIRKNRLVMMVCGMIFFFWFFESSAMVIIFFFFSLLFFSERMAGLAHPKIQTEGKSSRHQQNMSAMSPHTSRHSILIGHQWLWVIDPVKCPSPLTETHQSCCSRHSSDQTKLH